MIPGYGYSYQPVKAVDVLNGISGGHNENSDGDRGCTELGGIIAYVSHASSQPSQAD